MPRISNILEKGFGLFTIGNRAFTPPFYAVIEVNDRCCLRCKQCNLWKTSKGFHGDSKGKQLSPSEIVKTIRDIRKWNPLTKTLMFCGGEPFLEKEIFRYVRVAKKLDFFTTITTNGFLINEEMAFEIVDSGLDELCFSLDAPFAEIHDDIRGVKGSFERVMKANEFINKAKTQLGKEKPNLKINTVISNINYKYLAEMPVLLKKMGINEYSAQYITVMRPEIKAYVDKMFRREVSPSQWILPDEFLVPKEDERGFWKVIENLKRNAKREGINLSLRLYDKVQPCSILWGSLLVDNYGNVFPCTMIRDQAGNVRNREFKDIWNHPRMKRVRSLFNARKLDPVCKRCCIYPNVIFR
ncbi:MAG: radical SAM protein [Candidatus Nanoarchaeia archaeon]|nr:radical SAM protein [Candidatus Nanoarchaeia archaeon]